MRWTVTSTRKLAAELTRQGHPVGADTVAALLKAEGFSLQGTSRTTEGARHPDRDAQFRSSNGQVKEFTAARQQVISVDTKKQEVLGSYAVGGREWHRTGAAATGARPRLPRQERPEASALRQLRPGRLRRVGVGGLRWGHRRVRGRDLRRWWNGAGRHRDPAATRLLITADAGGANGYRVRAWKQELAGFAPASGPQVTVLSRSAGHLQGEQDRAPAVLPDQQQLARPPADQPRSRRRHDRRHHHPYRAHRPRRVRPQRLSHRRHDPRRGHGGAAADRPRLARHLELHPAARAARTATGAALLSDLPEVLSVTVGELG